MTKREKFFHWGTNLLLAVALFFVIFVASPGEESHSALCAQQAYYEDSQATAIQYLKDHPESEPIPGITRAEIQRGIENRKKLLKSFAPLNC